MASTASRRNQAARYGRTIVTLATGGGDDVASLTRARFNGDETETNEVDDDIK